MYERKPPLQLSLYPVIGSENVLIRIKRDSLVSDSISTQTRLRCDMQVVFLIALRLVRLSCSQVNYAIYMLSEFLNLSCFFTIYNLEMYGLYVACVYSVVIITQEFKVTNYAFRTQLTIHYKYSSLYIGRYM